MPSKWDRCNALQLIPCAEVKDSEACGIFCVPKSSEFDRLILNPSAINAQMIKCSNFTKFLTPGSILCLAHLQPNEAFRFSADDLSEFYYTFKIPYERARRNAIRMVFQPFEVSHFSVYDPRKHNTPVYLSLNALAMGDLHAVEIAQQSHFNLLSFSAHSLLSCEFACFRRPAPRAPTWEMLAIDDHLVAQKIPLEETLASSRLSHF